MPLSTAPAATYQEAIPLGQERRSDVFFIQGGPKKLETAD